MTNKLPVKVHPVASIFPMMSDEEFSGLKADIQANDVREPIVFWKEQLIDGRNRMAAMLDLGIDWNRYSSELDADIDPVAYVISHNLHRRHLSTSQRAMVAARLRETFDAVARERSEKTVGRPKNGEKKSVENLPPNPKARDEAGSAVGVSGKLVDHATAVIERGSAELIRKVDAGEVAVSKAAKIARTVGKSEQVAALDEPHERNGKSADEKGPFAALRKVFDSMNKVQQVTALGMWKNWMDPE